MAMAATKAGHNDKREDDSKGTVIEVDVAEGTPLTHEDYVFLASLGPQTSSGDRTRTDMAGLLMDDETVAALHRYRDFFAVHGVNCNVAMVDGSVKTIIDRNGDGYLNSGFPVGSGNISAENGFTDGECEINVTDVFTGTILDTTVFTKTAQEF